MIVSECSPKLLRRQLRRSGVCIRTGPVICRIQSPLPEMVQVLSDYYGLFPLLADARFADIQVQLLPGWGLRRWIRPQVVCRSEDQIPFFPQPRRLAPALLEWGLNWAVTNLAHWYLMVHGAVLERSGKALVLSAKAESGKSTLAAALMLRGWRLFSDEIVLIRLSDAQLVPLARPICLKGASIQLIRQQDRLGLVGPTLPDLVRGGIALVRPTSESVCRMLEPAPVGWVLFPEFTPRTATQWTPLPKALAFIRLADNSFNYSLLGAAGFQTLAALLDQAHGCYKFRYSNLDEAVGWLERLAHHSVAADVSASPPSVG
ncbi:MAG: HprK-related kinase A [Thermoguttaceae bacterium]|nr:HprK-related kinase A [Thermoguttaceae bacterium]MDW8036591.1 HprK-related kinase A [Thermoguttaceae bacterium]